MALDYKKAGVDIEAGYKSVELMKEYVKGTTRPEVLGGLGGFSGAFSLSKIKEMLSNDIPVLFSVGPSFFHKEKLPLYSKNVEGTKLVFKPVQRTKDHYMIITGVLEGEKTMLEISSWGKRFYISYEEYIKYIKKYDNYFFSNILYIKKKGTKKK